MFGGEFKSYHSKSIPVSDLSTLSGNGYFSGLDVSGDSDAAYGVWGTTGDVEYPCGNGYDSKNGNALDIEEDLEATLFKAHRWLHINNRSGRFRQRSA
jgi:hypothetical protein